MQLVGTEPPNPKCLPTELSQRIAKPTTETKNNWLGVRALKEKGELSKSRLIILYIYFISYILFKVNRDYCFVLN